jgi:predicted Abi (CAAX) family protease
MLTVIERGFGRLWRGLKTAPDASAWRFSLIAGAVTLLAMAVVGFLGGLYRVHPPDLAGLPLRLASVLLVPALSEEAFFRGLLVPDRTETTRPAIAIAAATIAFTAWHAVETLFLHHAAPVFLRPDFLACAAILGVGCAVIRWRTASLWPAVALHWLLVVGWQTWLGGPSLQALK